MLINKANLADLNQGFSAVFQGALGTAPMNWSKVATKVSSSSAQQRYAFLAPSPALREWLGDRHVKDFRAHDYTLVNRKFELTMEVPREDVEDDNISLWSTRVQEMAWSADHHIESNVMGLLASGLSTAGYDGVNFFGSTHPDASGGTQSNTAGGGGTAWYLLTTKRPLKPLIYQEREAAKFTSLTADDDHTVFWRDVLTYGVRHRGNFGYGLWQLAYHSAQTLNEANFAAAREAMMALTDDEGKPLGIVPDTLVVPPSLELEAEKILSAERNAAGETNTQRGKAQLIVSPFV